MFNVENINRRRGREKKSSKLVEPKPFLDDIFLFIFVVIKFNFKTPF